MGFCPRLDRVSRSSADCRLCMSRPPSHSHSVGSSADTLVCWINASVNGSGHNQTSCMSRCNGPLIQRSWQKIDSTRAKISIANGLTESRSKSSMPTAWLRVCRDKCARDQLRRRLLGRRQTAPYSPAPDSDHVMWTRKRLIELAECMVRRVNAREKLRMKESLRQCIRPLGGEFSPGLDEIRRVPVL